MSGYGGAARVRVPMLDVARYPRMADGVRGTLTDAFGVYSDPAVSACLQDVALATRRAA